MPRFDADPERFTSFDVITKPLMKRPCMPAYRVRLCKHSRRGTITWMQCENEHVLQFGPVNTEHWRFIDFVRRFLIHLIPEAREPINDAYEALEQRFNVEKEYRTRELRRDDLLVQTRRGLEWTFRRSTRDGLTVEMSNRRLSFFRLTIRSSFIDLLDRIRSYDNSKGFVS